jgi:hypothetical protein
MLKVEFNAVITIFFIPPLVAFRNLNFQLIRLKSPVYII